MSTTTCCSEDWEALVVGGPTMADTVKSLWCILSVSQSTFLRVLQKITA